MQGFALIMFVHCTQAVLFCVKQMRITPLTLRVQHATDALAEEKQIFFFSK